MKAKSHQVAAYWNILKTWGGVTPLHDDLGQLTTETGKIQYALKIIKHLPHLNIHTQIDQLQTYQKLIPQYKLLLAAPYIRKSQAELLIQNGIDYVDLVGNVHLHSNKVFIHVEGHRPAVKPDYYKGRMLQRSGLQVLFVLLTQPGAVKWTYRKLAQAAGVVHGSVGWVFRDMREQGFILGKGEYTTLARKKELLGMWVHGYGTILKPKLVVARYRPMFKDFEDVMTRFEHHYAPGVDKWALTGTQAAYRIQHFYRDATLSFFAKDFEDDCAASLKWVPDPNGSIIYLHLFSEMVITKADGNEIPVTHPLVTYADLMNDNSDRAREAAKMLYGTYLKDVENED